MSEIKLSKSMTSIDLESAKQMQSMAPSQIVAAMNKAQSLYNAGAYMETLNQCEKVYEADAYRTDTLLLLGAVHFQLRNFSESIFYNQQCIRVDPNFAEAYSNLGNALKELGDMKGATQFYLKVLFCLF
jgi:protein O-GlcNAc transferase